MAADAGGVISSVAAVAIHDPWAEEAETLARRLATARDRDSLIQLAPEARGIACAMIDADVGGALVTRTLSALNDALAVRILQLTTLHHRLPSAPWCWLAFGSEGRGEQTFVTDQDNGIVFSAADAAEARALRPLYLACAAEINQTLADCGFPLCSGGIMAGNPECCLSLDEWRDRFAGWVRTPEPQALLNATIYFDMRPLFGNAELAGQLHRYLAGLTGDADAFLRLLSEMALAVEPPLGMLRDFAPTDGKLDLKKFGARLFVDAARILGIASPRPATTARLRHAVAAAAVAAAEAEAAVAAFHQLQRIRLLVQLRAGSETSNLVSPDRLNAFDRQVLLETFKQARMLQQRLKMTFRIEN